MSQLLCSAAAPMTDYDSPWKERLDGYFPAFMAFFFSKAYRDIDWDLGYGSLDKELQQIVRDAELGKRLADIYNYRLFDRYDRPMVSLAVLSDTRPNRRPDRYGYQLWGCEVGIKFPVIKLCIGHQDTRRGFSAFGMRVGMVFPIYSGACRARPVPDYRAAGLEALEALIEIVK